VQHRRAEADNTEADDYTLHHEQPKGSEGIAGNSSGKSHQKIHQECSGRRSWSVHAVLLAVKEKMVLSRESKTEKARACNERQLMNIRISSVFSR
jgi:hypothetical protein